MSQAIESPCTGVCTLDPEATRCVGCGRTLDEIARWATMTTAARRIVMERVKTPPG